MENSEKINKRAVISFAGGFLGWLMGSGFATGQELLQFFSGYGFWGYAAIAVNLAGFSVIGGILVMTGYRNREERDFDQLQYFCGRRLGTFYSWLIPLMLIPTMAVLISGAGATLHEYYGMNHYVGAALMSILVMLAYLIGFQRFIRVVSMITPLIVIFSLTVGIAVICMDAGRLSDVPAYSEALASAKNSPTWYISGVLYISLTFLGGSSYYTALGSTGTSEREIKLGTAAGVAAMIVSITVLVTAMLCNAGSIVSLDVPNLYLAGKVSPVLGGVFSIMLILGIFSACSAMMWTVCSKFRSGDDDVKKSRIFAICMVTAVFFLSLFSFSGLMSVLYPFIGYTGLVYMLCVLRKGVLQRRKKAVCAESVPEINDPGEI